MWMFFVHVELLFLTRNKCFVISFWTQSFHLLWKSSKIVGTLTKEPFDFTVKKSPSKKRFYSSILIPLLASCLLFSTQDTKIDALKQIKWSHEEQRRCGGTLVIMFVRKIASLYILTYTLNLIKLPNKLWIYFLQKKKTLNIVMFWGVANVKVIWRIKNCDSL